MSTEARAHAARLGMWVFLASEVLFFGVLFTLYAAGRARYPEVFRHEVHDHADKVFGSINTALLLVSSTCVASGVRAGPARRFAFTIAAALIGIVFLGIKTHEYVGHFHAGLMPGSSPFWTLYFTMTGLHAVHVAAGVTALFCVCFTKRETVYENVALYWHFVDAVWIFLWPLFYLA